MPYLKTFEKAFEGLLDSGLRGPEVMKRRAKEGTVFGNDGRARHSHLHLLLPPQEGLS